MGIKDLNPLIASHDPDYLVVQPATSFFGQRIAIDAMGLLISRFAVAWKKRVEQTDLNSQDPDIEMTVTLWLDMLLDFVCTWLSYGVTPVFIFETGKNEAKEKAHKERQENREKAAARLTTAKEVYRSQSEHTDSEKERMRTIFRGINPMTRDHVAIIRSVLEELGIPTALTNNEAEHLCSALCIEGWVGAVWSVDTDNLVYGCPCMITGFNRTLTRDPKTNLSVKEVKVVYLERVLRALKWENKFNCFRDLCILLSCDYNDRIRGVGPKRGYEYLDRYGSLEEFQAHSKYDFTPLRINECRRNFATLGSRELICQATDLNVQVERLDAVEEILKRHHLERYTPALRKLYHGYVRPRNLLVPRPPNKPNINIEGIPTEEPQPKP